MSGSRAITRSQGEVRSNIPLVGWDWQYQVLKVCPLAGWDRARVWDYVRGHDVPYNPLHERGYPSIGCTHCTSAVAGATPAHYTRAGRWRQSDKTECGLHGSQEPGVGSRQSHDSARRLRHLPLLSTHARLLTPDS